MKNFECRKACHADNVSDSDELLSMTSRRESRYFLNMTAYEIIEKDKKMNDSSLLDTRAHLLSIDTLEKGAALRAREGID